MSQTTTTHNFCDKCNKELTSWKNNLNILIPDTSRRMKVVIEYRTGAELKPADLCHACAINVLRYTLEEVTKGVRATAGAEFSMEDGWSEDEEPL